MKKSTLFLTAFALLIVVRPLLAQTKTNLYKERALNNLKYLTNDFEIKNRVQIDDTGIIIYTDHSKRSKDLVLYWKEVPKFIDIIEQWDYYDMVKTFGQKGQQAFVDQMGRLGFYTIYKEYPDNLNNMRIAIDPGHFGGNMQEANYEMRFAKFRGQDIGQKDDVEFYEADLAYGVAMILRERIINAYPGAQVLITRPYAASSIGKPFSVWYKNNFKADLAEALRKGDVTKNLFDVLNDSATHERFVFENFYKFLDFRTRAAKINEFRPDVTFAIHFNAKEGNRRFGERYLMPVEDDYSMAFVPGAFLNGELSKTDQKVDFIRLLLSADMEKSIRLAGLVLKKHNEILNVPPIPPQNDIAVLRDASVATDQEGVYCRNLVLTRMARSVVVYGESLYQDNIQEIKKLSQMDYEIFNPEVGVVKTSSRCADVAKAYFEALEAFVKENKSMNSGDKTGSK